MPFQLHQLIVNLPYSQNVVRIEIGQCIILEMPSDFYKMNNGLLEIIHRRVIGF